MPASVLRLFRRVLLGAACLCATAASAQTACPPGEQPACLGGCVCLPVSPRDTEAFYEQVQWLAAAGLETWIRHSRDQLALQQSHAIPLHIRSQLEPYFPLAVLETARYRVGDDVVLNAANTLLQNPDVSAVTLIDIIVFRNEADALDNLALWAHELTHVQQYLDWGVGEFARRYTLDHRSVERPAYALQIKIERGQEPAAASGPLLLR